MSEELRLEEKGSYLGNEELIEMLEECDDYVKLQNELGKILSSAFFLQSKAKKSGTTRMNLAENMREDFDAVFRVDANDDGEFGEWQTKPKVDPIMYISAMPNRDLKHSQKLFKQALSLTIALSSNINKLKAKQNTT